VKQAQKAEARERAANTFEAVAERWFEKWKTEVTASTAESQWNRLVKHIMPVLGPLPISGINHGNRLHIHHFFCVLLLV
jgi:hypothetical protein